MVLWWRDASADLNWPPRVPSVVQSACLYLLTHTARVIYVNFSKSSTFWELLVTKWCRRLHILKKKRIIQLNKFISKVTGKHKTCYFCYTTSSHWVQRNRSPCDPCLSINGIGQIEQSSSCCKASSQEKAEVWVPVWLREKQWRSGIVSSPKFFKCAAATKQPLKQPWRVSLGSCNVEVCQEYQCAAENK